MRLLQLTTTLIQDLGAKLARRAIVAFVIVICTIGGAIEGTSAARYALEPLLGPVGARLALLGGFCVIAVCAVAWLLWSERRHSRVAAARARADEDPRAAIIAEAVSLGYSLGRDFMKATADDDSGTHVREQQGLPETEDPVRDEK